MNREIVLASTSPRRQMLLKKVCEQFSICAPSLEKEILDAQLSLPKALEKLALEKAESVAKNKPAALVIGADTIVCKDGKRLGKPIDEAEARAMLQDLSGATHEVITAVAMVCLETHTVVTNHAVSAVTFRPLTEADLADYIATGEPIDKAGAYGIQGEAGKFVTNLSGDFENVVGLPTVLVREMLKEALGDGKGQRCR